jgi:hypothetical protein
MPQAAVTPPHDRADSGLRCLGARDLAQRAQDWTATATASAAGRAGFATTVAFGIRAEAALRRAHGQWLARVAQLYGLATQAEVTRLRERVSALQHRLESIEGDVGHRANGGL